MWKLGIFEYFSVTQQKWLIEQQIRMFSHPVLNLPAWRCTLNLQGGHWGSEHYRLPVFFTILSTNYRLFNTLSTNFIDVYFQDILPWNRPGTWLSTQLDFHLKKFAHFWMWHDEEAKMGLSLLQILCTSCFILMVMCKESSKPSKLSTKLSTIWQINDYLSNKSIID